MKLKLSGIQQLGRALMLPIAVLPAAALLLRFGQGDLLNLPFMAAAGAAIFDNLGILFAIGIAVGFAEENNGAAGLAGVVGYFVIIKGAGAVPALSPEAVGEAAAVLSAQAASRMSIPVGILSGLTAGILYNRFHTVQFPDYLSFFGGRRFVPIITGFLCLGWAVLFGKAWPALSAGLDHLSLLLSASGEVGLFVYGALNRLLIVTGLHHIINNVVWFLHGSFTIVQDGIPMAVTGDLTRFLRGDPTAGAFMAGFFPVMMFGLPAACLAMYRCALPANRPAVGGMLLSMALTAFLTGITEPIEFTFMFLAPALYAVHAVLTGLALVIMNMLDVKLGFGFSAGFIDYVINFNKSTRPLFLLPVGAIYFIVYYVVFSATIRVLNLKTPGREPLAENDKTAMSPPPAPTRPAVTSASFPAACDCGKVNISAAVPFNQTGPVSASALSALAALGGSGNIISVGTSETRVVLRLRDASVVDRNRLRGLGVFGFSLPSGDILEMVFGPTADMVASELRNVLGFSALSAVPSIASADPAAASPASQPASSQASHGQDRIQSRTQDRIQDMILALGGPDNIENIDACATRLRLIVTDNTVVDDAALKRLGAHGLVRPGGKSLQVVIGPTADALAVRMQGALRRIKVTPPE